MKMWVKEWSQRIKSYLKSCTLSLLLIFILIRPLTFIWSVSVLLMNSIELQGRKRVDYGGRVSRVTSPQEFSVEFIECILVIILLKSMPSLTPNLPENFLFSVSLVSLCNDSFISCVQLSRVEHLILVVIVFSLIQDTSIFYSPSSPSSSCVWVDPQEGFTPCYSHIYFPLCLQLFSTSIPSFMSRDRPKVDSFGSFSPPTIPVLRTSLTS